MVDINAAFTKGIAGLNGASNIAGNAINAARINDTPWVSNRINELSLSGYNYNDYSQLLNSMNQTQYGLRQDYDKVRGMNGNQQFGTMLSSALSGATTGASIGGPWGAAIGAGIGLLGAGIGVGIGNRNARIKTAYDNTLLASAESDARLNYSAGAESLRDWKMRNNVIRFQKNGGQIERKQMDIKDFAAKVLNQPRARVVRQKCKGGVMIKINR